MISKLKKSFLLFVCLSFLPLAASWLPPTMISFPASVEDTGGGGDDLDVNNLNNAVAVWTTPGPDGGGIFTDVAAASYTFGVGWSAPVSIADPITYYVIGDQNVEINNSNYAVAVWRGADQETAVQGVFSATRDSNGNWSSPPVRISVYDNSDINFYPDKPQVALNDSGFAITVWVEAQTYLGVPASFIKASYMPQGGSWSLPATLSGPYELPLFGVNPQVEINSSGEAIAIWKGVLLNDSFMTVATSTFDPLTLTWSPDVILPPGGNNDSLGSFNQPHVGIDENGNGVAVWSYTDGPTTLFASSYVNGSWGLPIPIYVQSSSVQKPHVVVDQAGNATAMWESDGSIYSASLPFGGIWSSAVKISDPATNQNALNLSYFSHQLSVDLEGNVIGIYIQNFYGGNPKQPMSVLKPFSTGVWGTPQTIASQNTVQFTNIGIGSCGFAIANWISNAPDGFPHVWSSTSLDQLLLPPCDFTVSRCVQKFAAQKVTLNVLSWGACDAECILFYRLYKDGELIATIPAGSPNRFVDLSDVCCRSPVTYELTAVNIFGVESSPVTITVVSSI